MNSFQRSPLMMVHFTSICFIIYFTQVLSFNPGCILFGYPPILGFVRVAKYLLNLSSNQLFISLIPFPLKNQFLDLQYDHPNVKICHYYFIFNYILWSEQYINLGFFCDYLIPLSHLNSFSLK